MKKIVDTALSIIRMLINIFCVFNHKLWQVVLYTYTLIINLIYFIINVIDVVIKYIRIFILAVCKITVRLVLLCIVTALILYAIIPAIIIVYVFSAHFIGDANSLPDLMKGGIISKVIESLQDWYPILIAGRDPHSSFHNAMELMSFSASSMLLAVGIIGFYFAWRQWNVAEKTRMATVYTVIASRWFEDILTKSRIKIYEILLELRKKRPEVFSVDNKENKRIIADHLSASINELRAKGPAKDLEEIFAIIYYFEEIGMLVRRGMLPEKEMRLLLKGQATSIHDIFETYLKETRKRHKQAFCEFTYLVKRFKR